MRIPALARSALERGAAPIGESLRGALFWLGAVAIVAALAAPALLSIAIDRGDCAIHFFQRLWGRLTVAWVRVCGVRIDYSGLEHLELGRSAVLVANHQSMIDIFALSEIQPPHTRWVVKRELRALPVVGWAIRMAGFVFVDRKGDAQTIRRSFAEVEELLARPDALLHLLFFAEGTRTRDGRLRPFKRGAFRFAAAHRLPVVPIVIRGAFETMPRGRFARLGCGRVHVRVLPALEARAGPDDAHALALRTREVIERALEESGAARGSSGQAGAHRTLCSG